MARTPPSAGFMESRRNNVDEYVDMSPRNAGYVEMRPGELATTPATPIASSAPAASAASTPDGYVEMSYGRAATRPIAIAAPRAPPPAPVSSSPDDRRRRREPRTPLGSQMLFHISMESPCSPEDDEPHCLSTVRELAEDGRRSPAPEVWDRIYDSLLFTIINLKRFLSNVPVFFFLPS